MPAFRQNEKESKLCENTFVIDCHPNGTLHKDTFVILNKGKCHGLMMETSNGDD